MKTLKQKILLIIILLLLIPSVCLAQGIEQDKSKEEIFEAQVIDILQEREIIREDGSKSLQQNLKLKGLSDGWKDKEFIFEGIGDLDVLNKNVYKINDKLIVDYNNDGENEHYYIVDYVRRRGLYLLAFIFSLIIIIVGGTKGFKSLLSLVVTFFIIMKFIVPKILAGLNPLFISLIGSFLILLVIIYLTEGFDKISHLAIVSILISLLFTGILSIIFTELTNLTGSAQEEVMYLVGIGKGMINFKGLLLAGIIIGTLGVLDDVVISQLYSIREIRKSNTKISNLDLFRKSFKIGIAHISSMTNTLFLAYAGASLPLLLLFSLNEPPFIGFSQVINNEVIAVEIVRSLVGSIGIAITVPIATILGVYFIKD